MDPKEVDLEKQLEEEASHIEKLQESIFRLLLDRYQPAISFNEATHHYSLKTLTQLLNDIAGYQLFDPTHVTQWMSDNGFVLEEIEDLKFEWLLKKKLYLSVLFER